MKKIYISGCGGMLGDAFYHEFKDDYKLKCTDINVNEPWISHCDITDMQSYCRQVEYFEPDYLFHLGAITNLESCEMFRLEAITTNVMATHHAVTIVDILDIPLLYIGTAGIFDGKQVAYDEGDPPAPLGVYARTKYDGEEYVLNHPIEHLVCRASWMMGGGRFKDKTFVYKILKQIEEGKKTIHVVNDKRGTMTYTHDFAKNVKLLIEKDQTGLFNMANIGNTSRLEIAEEIIRILGYEKEIEIIGVPSSYFKKDYHAPRPDCECLINKHLDREGLNIMRPWKVALKEYLESFLRIGGM